MKLYELCDKAEALGLSNTEVRSITDDSKQFQPGDLFVCIKGETFDGHSVAGELLGKGAAAIVTETDLGLEQQIVVEDSRQYFAELASAYYGHPTKRLKLIAATGTNGKSTVIALIHHILAALGKTCGSIGTVGYDVCGQTYESHLTTPRQMDLYRLFREMADNHAEYCVMEASSFALQQNRFCHEAIECAIFTNLSPDHLDRHLTMEKYYQEKRRLFDMAKRAVVCADDKYGQKLIKYLQTKHSIPVMTYSLTDTADYFAINTKSRRGGVSYWLSSLQAEKSFPVHLGMPGLFNVANSMAAIAACVQLGLPIADCVAALDACKGVRGRSEVIYDGDFTVICDYAHTEDALVKFLSSVRSFAPARILCVFGAAGERDAAKRPAMGEAAAKYADLAFITSDNPRFEDPQSIIDAVAAGIEKNMIPYWCYIDREEAIAAALQEARKEDIVVLCGKGHETYQVIGDAYQPFDEREIVNRLMGGK